MSCTSNVLCIEKMLTQKINGHLNQKKVKAPAFFGLVGFQDRNKSYSLLHNNNKQGSEEEPDVGIESEYDRGNYDISYHKIEKLYNLHAKTNLPTPFISLQTFGTE